MDKPFKTYEELICKLRDEKKLSIPDEAKAIALLKKHGYFSLISGYKELFKEASGEYRAGTTIDDLLALFEFDNRLRDIFFQAIQIIEKHIKSLLSYAFTEKYGDDQNAYMDSRNYFSAAPTPETASARCDEINRLIKLFHEKVTAPFEQKYIEHQWERHKNVPLWVSIKAITFGATSKMYSLCTQDVQTAVSKEFPGVSEHQLLGMLDFLTRVRNVCAHNERLFDFNPGKKRAIQAMPIHAQLGIGKKKSYYKKGQFDLFAAVVCFKYLLSPAEFCDTMDAIHTEISVLFSKTKRLQMNKILSCMGFPTNWYDSVYL